MLGNEIIFKKEEGIALITVNRPEVHNALNSVMGNAIDRALDAMEDAGESRALSLSAAGGKSFVSGSDIKGLSKRTPLTGIETSLKRQGLLNRIDGLPIPSIAAINGYAFGVGCEIALACTFRLASENAVPAR